MALVVAFRNVSNLAEISDYEVIAYINNQQISVPFIVKGHRRSDKWFPLVERFVAQYKEKTNAKENRCQGRRHVKQKE